MHSRVDQQSIYVGEQRVEKVCPQPGPLALVEPLAMFQVAQRQGQNPDLQVLPPPSNIFLA